MNQTATPFVVITLAELPAIGQPLAGGAFAGLTTTQAGVHCAVVLLPDQPSERLHWDDATAWAAGLQAELPSRPVAALLFHHLRGQFEKAWHWTSETHEDDGSYAWGQLFSYGGQYDTRKSYAARARAVRLIPLSA